MQKTAALIPVLVALAAFGVATPQAFGLGYIIPGEIEATPGQTISDDLILVLKTNLPIVNTVVGESKDWITLGEVGDIPEGAERATLPYTITVPEDVEMQGKYLSLIAVKQRGVGGGPIVIQQQVYVQMTINVKDDSLPTKEGPKTLTEILAEDKELLDALNPPKPAPPPPATTGPEENIIPPSQGDQPSQPPVIRAEPGNTEAADPGTGGGLVIADPIVQECGSGYEMVDGICKAVEGSGSSWLDDFIKAITDFFAGLFGQGSSDGA